MDNNRYYTTYEVARMCQVTPGSVSRWIREGKLKTAVTPGGHHRIRENVVLSFLQSMRMPIPPELTPRNTTRIVIVEDDSQLRSMLYQTVQKNFPKIEIHEAEDGFAAGSKISELQPDLVILDLNLPGVDGFRICRLIKEKPALKHAKVIVVTGALNADSREVILREGADECFFKPFSLPDLVAKIKELIPIQNPRPL